MVVFSVFDKNIIILNINLHIFQHGQERILSLNVRLQSVPTFHCKAALVCLFSFSKTDQFCYMLICRHFIPIKAED